jgi:tetratricopeptide (TPR) repeat protein
MHLARPPRARLKLNSCTQDCFRNRWSPAEGAPPVENDDLRSALTAYKNAIESTGDSDAVEPLLVFLTKNPNSPWKPAIQLNLGIIYRRTGHFSKALEILQEGWINSQSLQSSTPIRLAKTEG